MSKKNKKEEPASNVKKGAKAAAAKSPAISLNDVKEATNASKNIILPAEAPQEAFPADDVQTQVPESGAGESAPESSSAPLVAPPAPSAPSESAPSEEVTEEIKHEVEEAVEHAIEESIEEVTEKAAEAFEAAAEPVVENKPSLQEQMLEKWLNGRNNVNHFELANSGVVDLNHFAMFEGVIGKFKFKRSHPGDNWQITVE